MAGELMPRMTRGFGSIDRQSARHLARIEAEAEIATAVNQARNAVAAAAAQADAMLGSIMASLPITDATDADFRAQLRQVTRAQVVADLYRFQP